MQIGCFLLKAFSFYTLNISAQKRTRARII